MRKKLPILIPTNYDDIFELYKTYVDSSVSYYKIGCSCENSISNMWNRLSEWIDIGKISELEKN